MRMVTVATVLLALGGMETMTGGSEAHAGDYEQATLGGGCFWCIEAVYEELEGVVKAESGYAGGRSVDPTYNEVCGGDSGHAEVVQVTYDPAVVSYVDILRVFFIVHDPTTLNRQGADAGTQYRSVIYAHDQKQLEIAQQAVRAVNEADVWPNPVVTEVAPLPNFFRAEDHHQDYYANNKTQGYCQVVINPKLAKFRKEFADRLKQ